PGLMILIYTHVGSLIAGLICATTCGVSGQNMYYRIHINMYYRIQELIAILLGKSIGDLSGFETITITGDMKDCQILGNCSNVEVMAFLNCPQLTSIKDIHPAIKARIRNITFETCNKLN